MNSRKIYGMQMPSDSIEPIEIYDAAKRLTDLTEKYDLTKPFGQRRTIVAVYKELEKIAHEKGIGLDLINNVAVPCALSERQLKQNTINIFDLREYTTRKKNHIQYRFNLISDGHCCYVCEIPSSQNDRFLKFYNESTLEEFFSSTPFRYSLRQ